MEKKYWYQKNLRFLQTVLRATDIVNYDAKGVAEYMKKTNTDVLVVNAGGVMDFFPNPLPMANPNPFMKDGQDYLTDLCNELHAIGKYVTVRVDFRGVEDARYNQHPDWFAKNPDGSPKRTTYSPTLTLNSPCYLSYYANEHAVEFIKYLFEHYDLDGIWENALSFGTGVCYCDRCRERYKRDTGKELPMIDPEAISTRRLMFDVSNAYYGEEFDEYRRWKAVVADEHIKRIRDAVKSFGEEKGYSAEIFHIYNNTISKSSSTGHDNAKRHFDYLISCVFMDANYSETDTGHGAYDIINSAGSVIRFSRALQPWKQPVINTGGNGTRARCVCDPLVETRQWLWEIVSNGGGVWNCYFNGQHPAATNDCRAAYSEKDAFTFLADNTDVISDTVPVADVGLFYSYKNLDKFANGIFSKDQFERHFRGIERVLIEKHIPYNFVIVDETTKAEDLSKFKAILLPNAGILTEQEQQLLRTYVENGGGLVATYESSLYNEDGSKREDFALADLFGVHYTGESLATGNDYYFKIKNPDSPILKGITGTELLMNSGKTAISTVVCDEDRVANYLPLIANQPPEYAWPKEWDSPYAGIVARSYGRGKVVYFAHTIDELCYTNGHEDFTEVYANAVDYVTGGDYSLSTDAYRSVHTNLIVNREGEKTAYILSFVNTTGTQQRPVKEIIPVGPFTTRLHLGGKLADSKLLWGQATVTAEGEDAVITVDRLEDFASVQLTVC